jgi:hypothetical protein
MPVLRYFVFVGGALLALLLVCNAVLPQAPLPEVVKSASDMPPVRIKSERKWPERVVFDTTAPRIAPVDVARLETKVDSDRKVDTNRQASAAGDTSQARAREAFARMEPSELKRQAAVSAKVSENVAARAAEPAALKAADAVPPKMDSRSDSGRSESSKPKRRVAKVHPSRPMIIVAQQPQPHFGFFDSTW